jgi:hypothetical protein
MIVSKPAPSPYTAYNNSPGTGAVPASADHGVGSQPADVVEFSSYGLAASGGEKLSTSNPAVYANDVQLQGNLSRILMETLFGKDAETDESSEEELVRTMVKEPLAEQVLNDIMEQ